MSLFTWSLPPPRAHLVQADRQVRQQQQRRQQTCQEGEHNPQLHRRKLQSRYVGLVHVPVEYALKCGLGRQGQARGLEEEEARVQGRGESRVGRRREEGGGQGQGMHGV